MPPKNRINQSQYIPGQELSKLFDTILDAKARRESLNMQKEINELRKEQFNYQKERNKALDENRVLQTANDTRRLNLYEQNLNLNQQTENRIREANKLTRESNELKYILGLVADNPETKMLVLKSHPYFKNNPEIAEQLREEMDIKGDINQNIGRLYGMKPAEGILEARTLAESQYISPAQRQELSKYITNAEDQLEVTLDEMKNTPEYITVIKQRQELNDLVAGKLDGLLRQQALKDKAIKSISDDDSFEIYRQRYINNAFSEFQSNLEDVRRKTGAPIGTFPSDVRVTPSDSDTPPVPPPKQKPKSDFSPTVQDTTAKLSLNMDASKGMDALLSDESSVDAILAGIADDTEGGIDFSQPYQMSIEPPKTRQQLAQEQANKAREDFLSRNAIVGTR